MNLRSVHLGQHQALVVFDGRDEDLVSYWRRIAYQLKIPKGALVLVYQEPGGEPVLIYFREKRSTDDEYTVENHPLTEESLAVLIAAITEGDGPVMLDPVPF